MKKIVFALCLSLISILSFGQFKILNPTVMQIAYGDTLLTKILGDSVTFQTDQLRYNINKPLRVVGKITTNDTIVALGLKTNSIVSSKGYPYIVHSSTDSTLSVYGHEGYKVINLGNDLVLLTGPRGDSLIVANSIDSVRYLGADGDRFIKYLKDVTTIVRNDTIYLTMNADTLTLNSQVTAEDTLTASKIKATNIYNSTSNAVLEFSTVRNKINAPDGSNAMSVTDTVDVYFPIIATDTITAQDGIKTDTIYAIGTTTVFPDTLKANNIKTTNIYSSTSVPVISIGATRTQIINPSSVTVINLTDSVSIESILITQDTVVVNKVLKADSLYSNTVLNLTLGADSIIAHKSIVPTTDNTYNLGSATHKWKALYVSGGTIYLGNDSITEDNFIPEDTILARINDSTNVARDSIAIMRDSVNALRGEFDNYTTTANMTDSLDTRLSSYTTTANLTDSLNTRLAPYIDSVRVKALIGDSLTEYSTTIEVNAFINDSIDVIRDSLLLFTHLTALTDSLNARLLPYIDSTTVLARINDSINVVRDSIAILRDSVDVLRGNFSNYTTTANMTDSLDTRLAPYIDSTRTKEVLTDSLNARLAPYIDSTRVKAIVSDTASLCPKLALDNTFAGENTFSDTINANGSLEVQYINDFAGRNRISWDASGLYVVDTLGNQGIYIGNEGARTFNAQNGNNGLNFDLTGTHLYGLDITLPAVDIDSLTVTIKDTLQVDKVLKVNSIYTSYSQPLSIVNPADSSVVRHGFNGQSLIISNSSENSFKGFGETDFVISGNFENAIKGFNGQEWQSNTADNSIFFGYNASDFINSSVSENVIKGIGGNNWLSYTLTTTTISREDTTFITMLGEQLNTYKPIIQHTTSTAFTSNDTLTVAEVLKGLLTITSGTDTLTLPTATDLGTEIGATAGTTLEFNLLNIATGGEAVIRVNTGITASGFPTSNPLTLAQSATIGIARFRISFLSATVATITRIN